MPPRVVPTSVTQSAQKKRSTIGNRHIGTAEYMVMQRNHITEIAQLQARLELLINQAKELQIRDKDMRTRTRNHAEKAQTMVRISQEERALRTNVTSVGEELQHLAEELKARFRLVESELKEIAGGRRDEEIARVITEVSSHFDAVRMIIRDTMSLDGPAERIENAGLRNSLAVALNEIEELKAHEDALISLLIGSFRSRRRRVFGNWSCIAWIIDN